MGASKNSIYKNYEVSKRTTGHFITYLRGGTEAYLKNLAYAVQNCVMFRVTDKLRRSLRSFSSAATMYFD